MRASLVVRAAGQGCTWSVDSRVRDSPMAVR